MSDEHSENKELSQENKFAQMNGVVFEEKSSKSSDDNQPQLDPEQMVTTRESWRQPWVRITLVSGLIFILIAFLFGMINQGMEAVNSANKPDLDSQPRPKADNYVVSDRENQTGELKTKIALTSQERELQDLKAQPTPQPTPTPIAT